MTEADIRAILARAEAASPGPWRSRNPEDGRWIHAPNGWTLACTLWIDTGVPDVAELNAAFIAAARSDVPAICGELLTLLGLFRDLCQDPAHAIGEAYAKGQRDMKQRVVALGHQLSESAIEAIRIADDP